MKIAYICNGLVPECSDKIGCYRCLKPGMSYCHHTTDDRYALNGKCEDPENHPERFNKLDAKDESNTDYWEGEFDIPYDANLGENV